MNRFLRSATLLLLGCLPLQAVNASPACTAITMAPATTLPSGTAGVSYGPITFTASGSAATPYSYAITSGLPAGSGLSINSSSGDLSGTPLQAGSFILTVTAADANGCSGGRSYALDVAVGTQTINFTSTAPAAATVGGATYNVTATATSGLPVTFTIDATASGICSISGSTVSFTAVGTCVIDANQAGNASFTAAPQVQQSFAVGMGNQNITFTSTPPASPTVGGTYTVTATGGGSGNPVTFTIDATATSVCSISGAIVSFLTTGTCVIDADQAGNANYNAAPRAIQSFLIGKGNQTINFTSTAPAGATVGGTTYNVTATATSGLPVTFTIDVTSATICSISGSTVSFTAAGTCVIDANQPGDTNYNAAPQAQQSFAVGQGSQTISFTSTAPASATVGGTSYNVTATASSGLPVTFTIDATAASICSIAGSTVSFTAVGACVIDANQAGNANYTAAAQVQQSFGVGQGSQTISFTSTPPASATVGGATYTVTARASSGLPVTLTIDATAASVCSISGSTVSFTATGTCLIDANQAGNANYSAAPQAQQSFGVGQGTQAIVFTSTPPANAKVGGATYNVTATGGASGNPVMFTIDATSASVCSIAGSTVSFTAVGTCVIDANQAGNANYLAAPQAQQSFAVAMGDQTITFTSTAPATATVGGATYNVTATATSGLTVTFTIDATAASICSISGSTVSFTAVGICVIDADQAGDANWNPAPQAQQSFTVGQGSQTISFTSTAPANAKVGGTTYNVTATATSGLPVTLTIDATATSICSISGNTVSFLAVGTCKIDANQPGNANYTAAPQAQQSFPVAKGDQTISFTSTAPSNAQVNGATYNVTATASSGLAVTFTIDASATSICSIVGSTVSFNAGGTCVIDANQAGNSNYNAAPQAQQSFFVAKLDQTITFTSTAPANAKVGGSTYNVTATASSGLTVTFSAGSTACNVAGSTVSFVHASTCTVNADQAGNAQYNAAPQVQQSFAVAKGDQTINVSTTAPAFGSTTAAASPHTYAVTATATSGLAVAITIDAGSTSGACSVAGSTVTYGTNPGTCLIDADQAGNADWNAAAQVQQSTTVEIPATAVNDSHNVTGNVAIAVPVGSSVLNNDTGTAIAIKSYGASTGGEQTTIGASTGTAQGGTVTLNADGTYNYDPPANFTATDTFKYILGNDLAATSTGTVTLSVSDRIMVVATSGVGAANCKPQSACTLATADSKPAVASGKDLVFVESGSYSSATFSLLAGQNMAGQKVALSPTALSDVGITLAPDSVTAPVTALTASTTPSLSNSSNVIVLAGTNLVEYISINNSGGSAISANNVGANTSNIHDIAITGSSGGIGFNLTNNNGATFNISNIGVTTATGTAFSATGAGPAATTGGTVNVTGAVNTLSAGGGVALNIVNTTIGASGMTFKSISANGGNNGIILNNSAGNLSVTGDGSGKANGSGGSITNMTGTGVGNGTIYVLTSSGTINLKSMNLSIASGTYGDVFIDNRLNGNLTLNVTGCALSAPGGPSTQSAGLIEMFSGQKGDSTVVPPVPASPPQTTNIDIENTFFNGGETYGFFSGNAGLTTANITVNQSGFGTDVNTGVAVNLPGTTITNPPPFSIGISQSDTTHVTYAITNSTFWGASGTAGAIWVIAVSGGLTDPSATFTGSITGNMIGKTGVTSSGCSNNCGGIGLLPGTAGSFFATVSNNTIQQVNSVGLGFPNQVNPATISASAIIQNNTFGPPDTTGSPLLQRAINVSPGNSGGSSANYCASISGNTLTPAAGGANSWGSGTANAIRLNNQNHTVGYLKLPGYGGASNDPVALASYLAAQNTMNGYTTSSAFTAGATNMIGGASCP